MAVSLSSDSSITIRGISPAAGPGLTLLANPTLIVSNVTRGDYFADTFTVNPSTPTTTIDLGDIVDGYTVWIQTDQPIDVTLTQNAVDNTFTVDSFMHMNTYFTALKVANTSATVTAHINIVVAGERVTNPGSPGVF